MKKKKRINFSRKVGSLSRAVSDPSLFCKQWKREKSELFQAFVFPFRFLFSCKKLLLIIHFPDFSRMNCNALTTPSFLPPQICVAQNQYVTKDQSHFHEKVVGSQNGLSRHGKQASLSVSQDTFLPTPSRGHMLSSSLQQTCNKHDTQRLVSNRLCCLTADLLHVGCLPSTDFRINYRRKVNN